MIPIYDSVMKICNEKSKMLLGDYLILSVVILAVFVLLFSFCELLF